MVETAPPLGENHGHSPDDEERQLKLVDDEGLERPFFNSKGRHISDLPLDELNFDPFKRAPIEQESFDPLPATRFIIEATFGGVHEEQFTAQYERSLGLVLAAGDDREEQAKLDNQMDTLYDYFAKQAPRLIDVTKAFRERQVVNAPESITIMRLSFLVATQYA